MRVYSKLLPFEAWRLEEHLLRLDNEERRMRFSGGVGPEFVARHCRELNWMKVVVIGCFEAGVLRGAAELWLDTPEHGQAELAISVEHDWQDQGIGTELLARATTIARNRAISEIYMLCLNDNRRIQRIVQKMNGRLVLGDDQTEASLAVPFPTQLSIWEEAAFDGLGFAGRLIDQAA